MFEGIFQPMHLIVILVIVLIIFGPGKLPDIGKGLGKTIREFKKAMSGDENDSKTEAQKEIALRERVEIKKEAPQNTVEINKEKSPQDEAEKRV
jgi:sec-independent protein translocase protein TatA